MLQFKYRADLEGGATFEVTADQRDVAAFELEPFGCGYLEAIGTRPFTFARFMAWSAGRRAKAHKLTWDEFSTQCITVDDVPDEGEAVADPGLPAASAGSTSSSPSRRVGRSRKS